MNSKLTAATVEPADTLHQTDIQAASPRECYDAFSNDESPYNNWLNLEIALLSSKHNLYGNALNSVIDLVKKVAAAAESNTITISDICDSAKSLEQMEMNWKVV